MILEEREREDTFRLKHVKQALERRKTVLDRSPKTTENRPTQ
jgi:hypothetical protein